MEETETKRLFRSGVDRIIFGVCGGLGKYFQIDANLVRIICVILAFIGGIGIVLYVAAVLLVPKDIEEKPSIIQTKNKGRIVVGIILIVIGGLLLLIHHHWFIFPGLRISLWKWVLPLAIIIIGLILIFKTPGYRTASADTLVSGKRLYRLRINRVLLGVASGMGEYFNLDANIARLLWVLFILITGGIGLLLYILLYFLLPEKPWNIEPALTETTGKEEGIKTNPEGNSQN